ncbi:hypothetical protein LTR84_009099 [Exophiala bonariae]|uniref:EXPERA domain-containing protein n=1 Tax=Exophiala bonariae TaxID=1690606 RepID=A0AAV9MVJ7_9EURO|nr:hypothetical protein LTR84_009099 [Exophiala bonariae]
MPGGWLHKPIWAPYELYGRVDYVYGWPAWNSHDGFNAARGFLNLVETLLYLRYLWTVWKKSTSARALFAARNVTEFYGGSARTLVSGPEVAAAVLVLWSATVMTLSKSVLYWPQEYFGDYSHIGHNDWSTLTWIWVIPNGFWLAFPTYMVYVLGLELVVGLNGGTAEGH